MRKRSRWARSPEGLWTPVRRLLYSDEFFPRGRTFGPSEANPSPLPQHDFYVATAAQGGSDANNGRFPVPQSGTDGPFATFTRALQAAQTAFNSSGTTKSVGVRGGTYNQAIYNPAGVSGGTSWGAFLRVANYNGETVWVRADGSSLERNYCIHLGADSIVGYIEFDGINCDQTAVNAGEFNPHSCIHLVGASLTAYAHHIRLKNAEVIGGTVGWGADIALGAHHDTGGAAGFHHLTNLVVHGGGLACQTGVQCAQNALYVLSGNNLIEFCDFYDTKGICVQFYNGGAGFDPPANNIFRFNRVHDQTRNAGQGVVGIHLGSPATGNQIYNNLIYGIRSLGAGDGINTFDCPGGNFIWFNTIYNCDRYGILFNAGGANEVRNNIMYLNAAGNFSDGATGTVKDHNSTDGTNPQFANPAGGDFHLTASTPASIINAGVAIPGITTDFDGAARGAPPDIGAYEKV